MSEPPATIPLALLANAETDAGEIRFHLPDGVQRLGSRELAERAQAAAAWLAARDIGRGSRVGVLGPNRVEWAVWAYAAWWVRAALVPIQVPLRVRDPKAFQDRLTWMMQASGCDIVVCDPDLFPLAPPEVAHEWGLSSLPAATVAPTAEAADVAVIQFTSGSTADPKGVLIPHSAVISQFEQVAAGAAALYRPGDRLSGWAPFFHDLGLFCYLVNPMINRFTVDMLPTEQFARDPAAWLGLITARESNLAIAPQSAWAAALTAARRRGQRVDLSSLEAACFAAEGMDAQGVRELREVGSSIGLSRTALAGCYGLAEAVVGVTATLRDDELRIDVHQSSDGSRHEFVSSGPPFYRTAVRIVVAGDLVADGQIGEIQVAGDSMMTGYLDRSVPSPITDGWLHTGDLGYLRDGELYVTGRVKDMLIVMGQNYYPEDLEWAAGRVPGVRLGRCVAFVAADRAVVLIEASDGGDDLATKVRYAIADGVGLSQVEVKVVPNGTIEKTTSGKLRRSAMRDAFARGGLPIEA